MVGPPSSPQWIATRSSASCAASSSGPPVTSVLPVTLEAVIGSSRIHAAVACTGNDSATGPVNFTATCRPSSRSSRGGAAIVCEPRSQTVSRVTRTEASPVVESGPISSVATVSPPPGVTARMTPV